MFRPKPWLRMWIEWIHDPKMHKLTLAEIGAWWGLVTLAGELDAGGKLIRHDGTSLSIPEIATCLHITKVKDLASLNSMIEKMEKGGSLSWNNGTLCINHFPERQFIPPSETKEAVRERVRRHREKHLVTKNSLQGKDIPSPPPEPETEAEAECNVVTHRYSNEKSVTAEAALAEISNLHEKNFGIITPVLAEKFRDFVENYRGPVEWIKGAFAEAVKYKNRRWQYVEAILYSWQEKGGPHADRRERRDERERIDAHQRDPLAEARAEGWEVLGDDEPATT